MIIILNKMMVPIARGIECGKGGIRDRGKTEQLELGHAVAFLGVLNGDLNIESTEGQIKGRRTGKA